MYISGYFHPDLPAITAAMAAVNSLYSYTWDIMMDWGLITLTRYHDNASYFLYPLVML
jgi:hypothetical protein